MALADIETKLTGLTPVALSAFRIVVGFLFFLHGTSHLFGWPLASYLQPVGTLPWWAGIIEFLGGLYSWIFLLLVFTGGGSLSLDRFITRAKR
ncbi:integral membrane protein [Mycobacteroides abscessus subsp. massiliense]|nr:integral membrane protein [Mycobacteroides abscessus subsp. massiliense]